MAPLSNQPFFLEGERDRACLLLHGLGGGVYEFQPLATYLHQQGFTVQAVNYPGHDRPSRHMPASTWKQWYARILETYDNLAQHYRSITVIGFSTGCPLGLNLAAEKPLETLILMSPFMAIKHEWYYLLRPETYLYSIGYLIENVPRFHLQIRDKNMRQAAEQAAFFTSFNLSAVRSALELIDQVKPMLPQLKVPCLILQSPKDSVVDPAGASFIHQQLGSDCKKLHWLQHSDHIIPLDLEREEAFAQIGAFLQP